MIFASAFIMLLVLTSQESSGDESVNQTPSLLDVKEGAQLFIRCTYEYSGYPYLFWYVQQLDGGTPQVLLKEELADHTQTKREEFSAKHVKSEKSFHLQKEATEMNDSAVYFCALSGSNTGKVTFGSGTRLVVTPNLKTSEPSIYKLQPSKEGDRDISACLITDYFPAPITVGADINNSEKVNGSVVVVKENGKETPSYGTVVWGKGKKAGDCYAEYKNRRFQPESAEAATTCSEKTTGSFETDERLNLLSLTVLGLRVIFLKCVAFNLLFTFHAWSS